jgi:transcriptional regulator GlxA family with amidase domain
MEQVQTLSGFRSKASFFRVFKRSVGTTPAE